MEEKEVYAYAAELMNAEFGIDGWEGADLKVEDGFIDMLGDVEKLDRYTDDEIKEYIKETIKLFKETKEEERSHL